MLDRPNSHRGPLAWLCQTRERFEVTIYEDQVFGKVTPLYALSDGPDEREMLAVWNMLLLDGNCSDHTLTGAAKLRRILDDLIEARQSAGADDARDAARWRAFRSVVVQDTNSPIPIESRVSKAMFRVIDAESNAAADMAADELVASRSATDSEG